MLSTVEIATRQRAIQRGECPECGGTELVTDHNAGEIMCSTCGLVLRDFILDQTPEWRAFTPEERTTKVRVGSPTSFRQFDKGLSTTFQPYTDAQGKVLPMRDRLKMMRLRKWHLRASRHSSTQRNLAQAMTVLTRLVDTLRIPKDVVEQASMIYRKGLEKGLVRGRSITSLVAASLYAACRLTRTSRSLNAIVDASTRNRKEISRCYRLIHRELDLKMPIDEPAKYVAKIATKTGLTQKTQNLAVQFLRMAKEKKVIIGKGPRGIAAAALYIAAIMNDENISQSEVAKASGVTEVTVRNRYKGLDLSLGLLAS